MNITEIMQLVADEMDHAVTKFPSWPTDIIHAAAVVNEESGELTQAALKFEYESGSIDAARKEAVQVIVTALRFLNAMEHYEHGTCSQIMQKITL